MNKLMSPKPRRKNLDILADNNKKAGIPPWSNCLLLANPSASCIRCPTVGYSSSQTSSRGILYLHFVEGIWEGGCGWPWGYYEDFEDTWSPRSDLQRARLGERKLADPTSGSRIREAWKGFGAGACKGGTFTNHSPLMRLQHRLIQTRISEHPRQLRLCPLDIVVPFSNFPCTYVTIVLLMSTQFEFLKPSKPRDARKLLLVGWCWKWLPGLNNSRELEWRRTAFPKTVPHYLAPRRILLPALPYCVIVEVTRGVDSARRRASLKRYLITNRRVCLPVSRHLTLIEQDLGWDLLLWNPWKRAAVE